MNSHASYPLVATPQPPVGPEVVPLAVTIAGAVLLAVIGAPLA